MHKMYSLNVGCGGRPMGSIDGLRCINLDNRLLQEADQYRNGNYIFMPGDVRCLPFKDNMFGAILASDIIEHFPIAETEKILKEWRRVLKAGCAIEFRLPNLETICKEYLRHKDAKYTSWLLYGGQDYPGNFHYVCFDHKFFKQTVEFVGFKEVYFKEEGNKFEIKFLKTK